MLPALLGEAEDGSYSYCRAGNFMWHCGWFIAYTPVVYQNKVLDQVAVRDELHDALAWFKSMHAHVEGKIAIYGALAFFALAMTESLVSVALAPNFKLPGTLEYTAPFLMKIPCRDDRLYPYGFEVKISVGNAGVAWAMVCRDFKRGGWHWRFLDEEPRR